MSWPVEPADIFEALIEVRRNMPWRDVPAGWSPAVSRRSAGALRAADEYRLRGDEPIEFAHESEFFEAAVEHVLDRIRDVPLAASVRLTIASKLEVDPVEVGTLKRRRPA